MKSPKNFEKIAILKIGELVSFWGGKTHFGKTPEMIFIVFYLWDDGWLYHRLLVWNFYENYLCPESIEFRILSFLT